jgi:hypothetical protein
MMELHELEAESGNQVCRGHMSLCHALVAEAYLPYTISPLLPSVLWFTHRKYDHCTFGTISERHWWNRVFINEASTTRPKAPNTWRPTNTNHPNWFFYISAGPHSRNCTIELGDDHDDYQPSVPILQDAHTNMRKINSRAKTIIFQPKTYGVPQGSNPDLLLFLCYYYFVSVEFIFVFLCGVTFVRAYLSRSGGSFKFERYEIWLGSFARWKTVRLFFFFVRPSAAPVQPGSN